MDQLRKAWSWLQRHHFWVLIVVVSLVALGCWWSGAKALYQEFVSNKSTIQSAFTTQQNLRNEPFHANADIIDKQKSQIEIQKASVNELWRQLYQRQRDNVLEWPSNLSEQFHRYIEKLSFGDRIPVDLRNHYNNYVKEHFPELPKIVGARELGENEQGGYGGYGGGGYGGARYGEEGGYGAMNQDQAAEPDDDYLVDWLDQQRVRAELYMPTTPSSKRIWRTQEDLWVYEALLQIIAQTNAAKGSDRRSNAAIRAIVSLEVGQLAAQASRARGRIAMVQPPAAAAGGEYGAEGYGADPYAGGGDMMDRGGGGYGAEMDGGGYGGYGGEMDGGYGGGRGGYGAADGGDATLFLNRYVDADGTPIAATGDEGPAAFGVEFKRLPVRMQLVMDQRWIPQLIAECANAPLQVEVEEVLINPSGQTGGGYGGGGYGGGGYGAEYGSSGAAGDSVMTPEEEPNIKPVVIQGIIYIFNPPSQEAESAPVAQIE